MDAMSVVASPVDAKPYLPRNDANPISTAERERDRVATALQRFCDELGIEAMIAPSPPYSASVWVRMELWCRIDSSQAVAGRSSLAITITPKPFHRFPHEWTVDTDVCGLSWTQGPLKPLDDAKLRALVAYVAGRDDRPSLWSEKLVDSFLARLLRDSNSVEQIRRDPLKIVSWAFILIGLFLVTVNIPALVACLMAAAVGFIYLWREPKLVLSTGRPQQEPRSLIRLDSWQTVLRGLGDSAQSFRERLGREIRRGCPDQATCVEENIWYWGVDGKEERRQLVITFRRAIAFLQIYAYHNDLYVGWDSHVNAGTWTEKRIASGMDRSSGRKVVANSIQKGWHVPNEYDIADTAYLSEWIHAATTELVKETMAEHKVIQDIDFKILREQRRGIVGVASEGALEKRGLAG